MGPGALPPVPLGAVSGIPCRHGGLYQRYDRNLSRSRHLQVPAWRGTSEGDAVITGLDNSCTGGLANVNSDTLTAANGDTLILIIF